MGPTSDDDPNLADRRLSHDEHTLGAQEALFEARHRALDERSPAPGSLWTPGKAMGTRRERRQRSRPKVLVPQRVYRTDRVRDGPTRGVLRRASKTTDWEKRNEGNDGERAVVRVPGSGGNANSLSTPSMPLSVLRPGCRDVFSVWSLVFSFFPSLRSSSVWYSRDCRSGQTCRMMGGLIIVRLADPSRMPTSFFKRTTSAPGDPG